MALVAEPQRPPGAVGAPGRIEVAPGGGLGPRRRPRAGRRQTAPGRRRPEEVGGDVGAGGVEGEPAPAAAEGGDAAVAVGQPLEPTKGLGPRGAHHRRRIAPLGRLERRQRHDAAAGVVGVGHAAGKVGPGPPPRRRAGVGMTARPPLAEEPVARRLALPGPEEPPQAAPGRQPSDGQRRAPGGEVGVDRPGAAVALRGGEEARAVACHRVPGLPHPGEAHRHEARERRGLEVAAAGGLDGPERAQGRRPRERAHEPRREAPRPEHVPHLADGHQRRQGVADDLEVDESEPRLRQRGQLEGELRHHAPRRRIGRVAEAAAERGVDEDRHGEGPVAAVDRLECAGDLLGCRAARPGGDPRRGARGARGGRPGILVEGGEHRPRQERGGEVGGALGGVSPAAVGQLRGAQPRRPSGDALPVGGGPQAAVHEAQRRRGRRGGKRARREPARPVGPRAGREEALGRALAGGADRRGGGAGDGGRGVAHTLACPSATRP